MAETYYLGVYWGPRQEDAEACAQRLARMVGLLEPVDPLFARWFKNAKSLKETLKRPLDTELAGLRTHIQRKLMKDDRRQPMPDLGFSLGLWNGGSGGDDAWFSMGCGGYCEHVSNYCALRTPHKGPVSERVLTTSFQTAVLHALITAWDPDWGVAMSHSHQELIKDIGLKVPTGWVTYLSHRRGRVPPLPAPASNPWASSAP